MPRQTSNNKNDIYSTVTKSLEIKKNKSNYFFKLFFKLSLIGLILFVSLSSGIFLALWSRSQKLPDVSKIQDYTPSETTEIYSSDGTLLAKLYDEENRVIVPLREIPLHVQQAVISMEDQRFYEHFGIDIKGILRAIASYFDKSLVKGGASTITQQLARNLFLTPDVKISRKIDEWILSIKIERKFSKAKILELYLNQVYWGHNSYGVEAAARTFFCKSVKDLNLAEASLIGGLLSSPEVYSPLRNFKLAKWRQSLTLNNMVKNGFIKKEEAEKAKNQDIKLCSIKRSYKMLYPYFTSYVIEILKEKYGENTLRKAGLKVYTTIDKKAQELGEKLINEEISKLKLTNNITQGALVSIDPNTGFIKSIVGGISYEKSQFNRITQAKRQPGSAFKPFVYLTAFKEGLLKPNSIIVDSPISYPDSNGVWSPKNYDGSYYGALTVKDAIKYSRNTTAVKTLDNVGVDKVIETCKILGIESYIPPNLSIALGSAELTPLELATAYGVFATGGKKVKSVTPILRIEDRNGNIIENYNYQDIEEVYDSKAIQMLNECTRAVVESGTGTAAKLKDRPVAGKTGTTSDHKDSWFVGYIPQLVTLVWIGNDDNSRMKGATGGTFCAPIWRKYMEVVTKNMEVKEFPNTEKKERKKEEKNLNNLENNKEKENKQEQENVKKEAKRIIVQEAPENINKEIKNNDIIDLNKIQNNDENIKNEVNNAEEDLKKVQELYEEKN
jgi:penicillin-binding protein 1A